MSFVLRPYQVEAIENLRNAFRGGAKAVVFVLPTGGGKTACAAEVIVSAVAKGKRVLFLAHRKELILQASAKLRQCGVAHGVIQAGVRGDLSKPVQVASVLTLIKRLPRLLAGDPGAIALGADPQIQRFDLIVVDECHHLPADSHAQAVRAWPQARLLGLTATPYRLDGRGLAEWFQGMVVGARVSDLIAGGYLCPTRTFAPTAPKGLDQVKTERGEFKMDEAAKVMDGVGPIHEIVETWQRLGSGRCTVAFCCNITHATHLAEAFNAVGVTAAAVSGRSPADERAERLAQLADGRIQVLCNCNLLTEGWDLPAVSCVILARPTQSKAFYRQAGGRAMRPSRDKTEALILDHANNVQRFGMLDEDDEYLLDDEPRKEQRERAEALRVCPLCRAVNRAVPRCIQCGESLAKEQREIKGRVEAEMGDVDRDGDLNRFSSYALLALKAQAENYKPGWIWHAFRDEWKRSPSEWYPVALGIYEMIRERPPHPRQVEAAVERACVFARENPGQRRWIADRFPGSVLGRSEVLAASREAYQREQACLTA
jgi:superfamily II DNA or RNA helicase